MNENFFFLGLFSGLVLLGCSGSNEISQPPQGKVNPFVSGDILESLSGEFFGSECVRNGETSSMEKMTFSFAEPLSWNDEFFEQESLEFTGKLKIESIDYENPYCLGSEGGNNLITTSVNLDNISVVQDSIEENSFNAFYVQEQEKGQAGEVDSGAGILLKVYRENQAFHVKPLNSFTYKGKEFNLGPPEQNDVNLFSFDRTEKSLQSRNIDQVPAGIMRKFFGSTVPCGYYKILDESRYSFGDKVHNIVIIFSPYSGGVAMDLDDKKRHGSHFIFKTNNLDWIYVNGEIHTERNFIFRKEGDKVKIYHDGYSIDGQELNWRAYTYERLTSIMDEYNRTPDIFPKCQ